nr:NADPH-dependent ferric siderophore reductase [Gammaproteobacteria bacterium]
LTLPAGEGFVWAAGEHSEMAALRQIAVAKGASPQRMRIAAYWKRGEGAHHAELTEQD